MRKNLWITLERNWIHFFWLTGETPPSLRSLVHEIETIFFTFYTKGKGRKLDVANQVSSLNRYDVDLSCYVSI